MTETSLITNFTSGLSSHSLKGLLLHTSHVSSNKISRLRTNSDWKRYYFVRCLLKAQMQPVCTRNNYFLSVIMNRNHFKISNHPGQQVKLVNMFLPVPVKLNCYYFYYYRLNDFDLLSRQSEKTLKPEACVKMGSSASNYVWSHSDL